MHVKRITTTAILLFAVGAGDLFAQATIDDYQRAMTLRDKYTGLAVHVPDAPRWIEQSSRFYYRRTVKGGHEWMLVDGTTKE